MGKAGCHHSLGAIPRLALNPGLCVTRLRRPVSWNEREATLKAAALCQLLFAETAKSPAGREIHPQLSVRPPSGSELSPLPTVIHKSLQVREGEPTQLLWEESFTPTVPMRSAGLKWSVTAGYKVYLITRSTRAGFQKSHASEAELPSRVLWAKACLPKGTALVPVNATSWGAGSVLVAEGGSVRGPLIQWDPSPSKKGDFRHRETCRGMTRWRLREKMPSPSQGAPEATRSQERPGAEAPPQPPKDQPCLP